VSVRLMGPRGIAEFKYSESTLTVSCAKPTCDWWIDVDCVARETWEWTAATHECRAPWIGFTRYTIRPERPTGRRTS
jgi:hypothetical protein